MIAEEDDSCERLSKSGLSCWPGPVPQDINVPKPPSSTSTRRPQPVALKKKEPLRSDLVEDLQHGVLESMQVSRCDLTYGECVGVGCTANVYRGLWKGREVAIKEMNIAPRKHMEIKQEVAFLRETSVAAKICHANLVQFYGLSCTTQPFLLVTEFCSGGTCFSLLHEYDLELVMWQKLKIICDVAGAMEYLHKLQPKVIHRDLKSLNLLLSASVTCNEDSPHVKVSDFGLSKIQDENGCAMMTANAGTAHWMAPEVSTGQYDEKVDVYSFAMVVYESVCQEIPFDELEVNEVLGMVMAGSRPDLGFVPPDCPRPLQKLMQQCWEHDPSERPAFAMICEVLGEINSQFVSRL